MFALRIRSLWLLVFCLVVLAASSTATAKKPPPLPDDPLVPHITVVDFPDSAYDRFFIYDVNDHGTVVGQRDPDGNNNGEIPMGVVWFSAAGPTAVDLSTGCKLTGINNNNLMVGVLWDSDRAGSREVFIVESSNLEERVHLGKSALLLDVNPYGYGWPVINDQETVAACVSAGRRDKWWFGSYYADGQWTTLTEEGPAMVSDINNQGDIVGRRFPKAESQPEPAFVQLAGESVLDPGQYWDLDEQIVELQDEVDSFWLTGSAAAEQSIADLTPDTDPNGTGYSTIAGFKEMWDNNVLISCAYVLVPIAPDP